MLLVRALPVQRRTVEVVTNAETSGTARLAVRRWWHAPLLGHRGKMLCMHTIRAASQRTFLGDVPLGHQIAETHCGAFLAPHYFWTLRILRRRGKLAICKEQVEQSSTTRLPHGLLHSHVAEMPSISCFWIDCRSGATY